MLIPRLAQGLPGNITLKNGEKYTGVLSGTSLDPTEMRYVFKMVKKVQPAGDAQVNGTIDVSDDYVGVGDNHVMAFDMSDVADFHVNNVILDKTQAKGRNGMFLAISTSQSLTLCTGTTGFRTDTDISGNMAIRERTLQKWEPSADANADLSLEPKGASTGWDQFSANEKLFGVRSDYDENLYTTIIDRNNPRYAEKEARAARLAREIEGSSALNAHVREERGQQNADDKGDDEEERYVRTTCCASCTLTSIQIQRSPPWPRFPTSPRWPAKQIYATCAPSPNEPADGPRSASGPSNHLFTARSSRFSCLKASAAYHKPAGREVCYS